MSQLRVSSIATTAGVVNLTTNSLGVTPNNSIALHATRTGNAGGGTDGTYIKWNNLVLPSPYYNSSTGLFTVPIAGKYLINAHLITSSPGSAYIHIYKNGVSQSFSHINLSGVWGHLTVSGIISCNVNDTIGTGLNGTVQMYQNDHNGYSIVYLGT
jgi:hypothetical protein